MQELWYVNGVIKKQESITMEKPPKSPEERLTAVEQEVEDLNYILTGEVAHNGK